MKKQLVLLLLIFCFCFSHLSAQPDRIWALPEEQSLPAPPYGDHLLRTGPDGSLTIAYSEYFSVGSGEDAGDIHFFRLSSEGELLWSLVYDGMAGLGDIINDLVLDEEGNVYFTGSTAVLDSVDWDIPYFEGHGLLGKISAGGDLLWERTFPGPELTTTEGLALALGGDGYCYLAGSRPLLTPSVGNEVFLTKFTSDGELIWDTAHQPSGNYGFYPGCMQVLDTVVVIGGRRLFPRGFFGLRFSTGGGLLSAFEDVNDLNLLVEHIDEAGNFYARTGSINRFRLVKFSPEGELLWTYQVPSNQPSNVYGDQAHDIFVDDHGNVYATGRHYKTDVPGTSASPPDILTVALDSSGQERWQRFYDPGDLSSDIAHGVWVDAAGGVYVTGEVSRLTYQEDQDLVLLHYSQGGHLNWELKFDEPLYTENRGQSLIGDPTGGLYVTGISGSTSSLLVHKYDLLSSNEDRMPQPVRLDIYPNPTNGQVRVEWSSVIAGKAELQVYDTFGRRLMKQWVAAGEVVSLKECPPGLYYFELRAGNFRSTQKVLKQ